MENKKSPGRELGQLDNSGTHVYETLYWLQALNRLIIFLNMI